MTSVWGELRRRNVVKVAVAYAIVGWLLVEVASVVLPTLLLPDWTLRILVFFVILGFPLALFFAWAYELTPEGLKKERDVDPASPLPILPAGNSTSLSSVLWRSPLPISW